MSINVNFCVALARLAALGPEQQSQRFLPVPIFLLSLVKYLDEVFNGYAIGVASDEEGMPLGIERAHA